MLYNPNSLKGLSNMGKGRPKKDTVVVTVRLSPKAAEWLKKQPHKSEALSALIESQIEQDID